MVVIQNQLSSRGKVLRYIIETRTKPDEKIRLLRTRFRIWIAGEAENVGLMVNVLPLACSGDINFGVPIIIPGVVTF